MYFMFYYQACWGSIKIFHFNHLIYTFWIFQKFYQVLYIFLKLYYLKLCFLIMNFMNFFYFECFDLEFLREIQKQMIFFTLKRKCFFYLYYIIFFKYLLKRFLNFSFKVKPKLFGRKIKPFIKFHYFSFKSTFQFRSKNLSQIVNNQEILERKFFR